MLNDTASVLTDAVAATTSMPTAPLRTGGGFSLTQRSPRPRATHDTLPPPVANQPPPKFLKDLLLRVGTAESASERTDVAHKPHAPPSSPRSLELQVPSSVLARQRFGWQTAAQPSVPHSTTPRSTVVHVGKAGSAPPRAAAIEAGGGRAQSAVEMQHRVPATQRVARLSSTPLEGSHQAASSGEGRYDDNDSGALVAEPKRGLSGCTPRSPVRASPRSPVRQTLCGSVSSTVAVQRASFEGGLPPGASGRSVSAGGGVGEMPRGAVVVDGGAGASAKCGVSCVPFPSMRHAHHLASVPRPSAGPRFPPRAPSSRDESAVDTVPNYSIKPCIHDVVLSHRFGAKAASRVLADMAAAADVSVQASRSTSRGALMSAGGLVTRDALLGCGIMGGASVLGTREETHTARSAPRACQPRTASEAPADGAAATEPL